jgi:long-chain acyl-CoA synthetase
VGDVLREHRRSYPARTATVCGDHRATWPELDDRVNQLAHVLGDLGVGRGEIVLWLGQNCHRLLEGMLACARLGAGFCPVNWRQSASEMAFVIDDLRPAITIWQDAEIGETVAKARSESTHGDAGTWIRHDAAPDDPDGYEGRLAAAPTNDPDVEVDPADPVLLLYTAAFTGRPGAARLSHWAVLLQALMMANLQRIDATYTYLNCGPLFHVATFMTTAATFQMGGTNVFTPRVEAEELCRLVEAERCTGGFIMGPTITEIIELNCDGRFDISSLRTFGGSPEWNEMITVDDSPWAVQPGGYGQTEVMGLLTFKAVGGPAEGGAGRPSPLALVRVVDPDGNDVAPGETGEIVARGPTVMSGYENRDEENEARTAGGWHHTNDLGRREADGSLTFVGPRTRLIKSAAENIYPVEVENCLKAHDAVADAAVIGIPDPKWTQSVKAVVVLAEGATATAEELIEHCRSTIASYKKPRSVEFVDELPRQGWLVDYEALDQQFGGGGYPGS